MCLTHSAGLTNVWRILTLALILDSAAQKAIGATLQAGRPQTSNAVDTLKLRGVSTWAAPRPSRVMLSWTTPSVSPSCRTPSRQNGRDAGQAATRAAKTRAGGRTPRTESGTNSGRSPSRSRPGRFASSARSSTRCTIADEQLARRAAYRTSHDILGHGRTEHEAYIAGRRTAKVVHTS